MRLINVKNPICEEVDFLYSQNELAYGLAVKKCLQTEVDELEAISLLSKFDSYITEGMRNKDLPSACANRISKLT